MIHLNEIPLNFEPREKILPQLPACPHEPEMSESESAFLCGALKQFRPKKILEVGVAGGATTAIILQALEDFGEPYEMHSVDTAEKLYHDQSYGTGCMATFAMEKVFGEMRGTHKFHIGKFLPQVLDEIGDEIDFVILDTVHALPGEVLDFLAMLPYLKADAVVVLHDVTVHQYFANMTNHFSNATLFGAVTAEKFLNFDEQARFRYPNIGAFKITEQTKEQIDNVFLALVLPWIYLPSPAELGIYYQFYRKFYPIDLCEIFKEAIEMNTFNLRAAQHK